MMKNHDAIIQKQLADCGKRLKALRKAKGYTNYEQFAFEHEIGRAQYGRYEKGSDLRLSSLLKVLHALEITPADFFKEALGQEEGDSDKLM